MVRESQVTEDRTKLDTKWRADTKIFQEIDFIWWKYFNIWRGRCLSYHYNLGAIWLLHSVTQGCVNFSVLGLYLNDVAKHIKFNCKIFNFKCGHLVILNRIVVFWWRRSFLSVHLFISFCFSDFQFANLSVLLFLIAFLSIVFLFFLFPLQDVTGRIPPNQYLFE